MLQAGTTVLHAAAGVTNNNGHCGDHLALRWIDLLGEGEDLMDAVTALSGSGPAYFFPGHEAIEQAGAEPGLPADIARLLTLQNALGAARMAMESSGARHTAQLCHITRRHDGEYAENTEAGGWNLFRQALRDAGGAPKKSPQCWGTTNGIVTSPIRWFPDTVSVWALHSAGDAAFSVATNPRRFYNPISQFIVKMTAPLLNPLRQ